MPALRSFSLIKKVRYKKVRYKQRNLHRAEGVPFRVVTIAIAESNVGAGPTEGRK